MVAFSFVLCIDRLAMGGIGRLLLGDKREGGICSCCLSIRNGCSDRHGDRGEASGADDPGAGGKGDKASPRRVDGSGGVDCRRVCGWHAMHAGRAVNNNCYTEKEARQACDGPRSACDGTNAAINNRSNRALGRV
jgi:hypothetical protein